MALQLMRHEYIKYFKLKSNKCLQVKQNMKLPKINLTTNSHVSHIYSLSIQKAVIVV